MSEMIGISELAAQVNLHVNTLRKLADNGVIPSTRTQGGQRRFELALVQKALQGRSQRVIVSNSASKPDIKVERFTKNYRLLGLEEAEVWKEIVQTLMLKLDEPCADIFPYVFNEMLNNSIDHSNGESVKIEFIQSRIDWEFEIEDDGVGAFANVAKNYGLSNNLEAIAELSKGKRTTAPQAHTGEGIFFSSKSVDYFQIQSNNLSWTIDNINKDFAIGKSRQAVGTKVNCALSRKTDRKLIEIFKEFTKDHEFYATQPIIKLFETGLSFLSRSEAKRLTSGLDKFHEIRLDFAKVESIGQGFADELFRVWANAHPDIKLIPINMIEPVNFMVNRSLINK
jgi:excisionase family DNA binding protein